MSVELGLDDIKYDVRALFYILLPFVLLSLLFEKYLIEDIIHSTIVTGGDVRPNLVALNMVVILLRSISHLGVAIWFAVVIGKWERSRSFWFLFGLFVGYQLMPLYFLLYIVGIHPTVSSQRIIIQLENLSYFLIPVLLIIGPISAVAVYNFGVLLINTGNLYPEKLFDIDLYNKYLVNAAICMWFIVIIARFRKINKLPWALLSLFVGIPVVLIHTLFVSIVAIKVEGSFNITSSQRLDT